MTNREYMIEHFDDVMRIAAKMADEETCCCLDWFRYAGLMTLPDRPTHICNDNCVECINMLLSQNHE